VTFPAEAEPDGDVSAPHHYYIGLFVAFFAFVSVWDLYPVTGALLAWAGVLVALDDLVSHPFGVPTPLDALWRYAIRPAMARLGD